MHAAQPTWNALLSSSLALPLLSDLLMDKVLLNRIENWCLKLHLAIICSLSILGYNWGSRQVWEDIHPACSLCWSPCSHDSWSATTPHISLEIRPNYCPNVFLFMLTLAPCLLHNLARLQAKRKAWSAIGTAVCITSGQQTLSCTVQPLLAKTAAETTLIGPMIWHTAEGTGFDLSGGSMMCAHHPGCPWELG